MPEHVLIQDNLPDPLHPLLRLVGLLGTLLRDGGIVSLARQLLHLPQQQYPLFDGADGVPQAPINGVIDIGEQALKREGMAGVAEDETKGP